MGLVVDWAEFEAMHVARGLAPTVPAATWRTAVPVYSPVRQVGRATSGTWSPLLKQNVALASLDAGVARPGTRLQVEWTVEVHRGKLAATVVELPFLDLPRKRA